MIKNIAEPNTTIIYGQSGPPTLQISQNDQSNSLQTYNCTSATAIVLQSNIATIFIIIDDSYLYTYKWTNNGAQISTDSNADIDTSTVGQYKYNVNYYLNGTYEGSCYITIQVQALEVTGIEVNYNRSISDIMCGDTFSIIQGSNNPLTMRALLNVPINYPPIITYQWSLNNVAVQGATGQAYTATPPSLGTYSVTAQSNPNQIPSCSIIIQQERPLEIIQMKVTYGSASIIYPCNDIFSFTYLPNINYLTITPTLSKKKDVTYQWFTNGNEDYSATGSSLVITNPIGGSRTNYELKVTSSSPAEMAMCVITVKLNLQILSNLTVGIYVLVNNRLKNFACGNTIRVNQYDTVTLIANTSSSDVTYEWISDNAISPTQNITVDTSIPGTYVYTTRIQTVPGGNAAYCTITIGVDPFSFSENCWGPSD